MNQENTCFPNYKYLITNYVYYCWLKSAKYYQTNYYKKTHFQYKYSCIKPEYNCYQNISAFLPPVTHNDKWPIKHQMKKTGNRILGTITFLGKIKFAAFWK